MQQRSEYLTFRYAAKLLILAILPVAGRAQQLADAPQPPASPATAMQATATGQYQRPTRAETLHDILSDAAGPYSITMALFTAGIHQATNNPADWGQGAAGFSKRFGSNMGITLTGTAVRYSIAEAMNVNTLYYRCSCAGAGARARHAVLSTVIARQRDDGAAVFSYPNVVAPYAATMTAVYAWYPRRYGEKDAFRMGNYDLLGTVGSNLIFEFMPVKVHEALARMHLSSSRMADSPALHPQAHP